MRGFITRAAAVLVIASVALGAAVAPCAAAEKTVPQKSKASLTQLSSASKAMLAAPRPARAAQQSGDPGSSPSGFFHSKRGAVALVLMGAGAGFTVWSVNHDRKPVKSPIR